MHEPPNITWACSGWSLLLLEKGLKWKTPKWEWVYSNTPQNYYLHTYRPRTFPSLREEQLKCVNVELAQPNLISSTFNFQDYRSIQQLY